MRDTVTDAVLLIGRVERAGVAAPFDFLDAAIEAGRDRRAARRRDAGIT